MSAPPARRIEGKAAVVVGAGQARFANVDPALVGNGRAVSLLFARHGARLLLVDRDEDQLEATAELARAEGATVACIVADVTDEDSVAAIPAAAVAALGRIDILVNNVGIGNGDTGATKLPREVWDNIFAVNATGSFLTCKHVLPVMRRQNGGAIVNISSTAAVVAAPLLAYKASKAAQNALTHHLAMANARFGIRVNGVMPGLMNTPMAIGNHSQAMQVDAAALMLQRDQMVPLRQRQGTAWDTANAVLFLASDDAAFITGVLLPVDGGQTARIG